MSLRIVSARLLLIGLLLLAGWARAWAQPAPNAVTDWAAIVQQAIHNGAAPRSAGTSEVLHTMVTLAVYDAVPGADVRAAVATAAYLTARPRLAASQRGAFDLQYAAYLLDIVDGPAKTEGIRIGQDAATAMLALRAGDGFGDIVLHECHRPAGGRRVRA